MGLYIAVATIFLLIIIVMYGITKVLRVRKLFWKAFSSFIIVVALFGGATYLFFAPQQTEEILPELEEIENAPKETPFIVKANEVSYFESFQAAVAFARASHVNQIYFQDHETVVWERVKDIPQQVLQVPLILQLPELERGAEVTSLAMLLTYAGKKINKVELAQRLKKDQTPLTVTEAGVFFGHPNDGFVGNIYDADEPSLGVSHRPIWELAEHYLPGQMIDMTGANFEDVLYPIHQGHPVWAIIHTQYKTLPQDEFQTWQTPSGDIEVTRYRHAILITGYDEKRIYYNDPMSIEVNRPISIKKFKEAWEQMGRQAISYVKPQDDF
ncbi:C39 family peptidase [Anaerobacillus sp. CMMVII]|uniref:C39 family peptidase n=1 Tax=Anaerobacillus sp. CMMVII TaxID=2755588 RepID=UPI0021B78B67|nr:C39 family peptidase [Anaerobacillus sp. CMMVII]MCT8140166.1 C39 family peptidase [Anaerobacillus sp. CMMVII]